MGVIASFQLNVNNNMMIKSCYQGITPSLINSLLYLHYSLIAFIFPMLLHLILVGIAFLHIEIAEFMMVA